MQYTQQQRLAPEVTDESALYSPIGLCVDYYRPAACLGVEDGEWHSYIAVDPHLRIGGESCRA